MTNRPAPTSYLQTIVPHRPDGTALGAAPYEVAFLPQNTNNLDPSVGRESLSHGRRARSDGRFPRHRRNDAVASPGDVPSRDLIALLELPSGQIVDSGKHSWPIRAGKPIPVPSGSPPACPVNDCLGSGVPRATVGSSSGGGGSPAAGAGGSLGGAGTGFGGAAGAPGGGGGGAGTAAAGSNGVGRLQGHQGW